MAPTTSVVVEPKVVRVVRVQPPMIPEGLKVTVLKDPSTLEPATDCPVVKWGDFTYWPFSYVDNRYSMCLVAYDSSPGSKAAAAPLKQWELKGARYVVSIAVDASLQRITLLGQSSRTVSASWADIGKVIPSNPQYFWILHKASRLACSAPDNSGPSSSIPLQNPDVVDRQLWLFDEGRQAVFPKPSCPQLDFCLDLSNDGSVAVLSQTNWGRSQQRWIMDVATQNLKPITSSLVAANSDSNTVVLQPRSGGSVSQLWQLKPFIPSLDLSSDQFPLVVPDQPFALSNLNGFLLKSAGQNNPLVACSQSLVERNGYWLYKRGYGGVVNVQDGLAITSSGGSLVTASPWTSRPQQQWVLTTTGYLVCRANNGVLILNSSVAGGTVSLASFDPLDRVDQRWLLQFSSTATKRAKRSVANSKVDRITKVTVTAKVSNDFFAGTIDYIYISLGDGGHRQLLFRSPARGDSATITIDMQSMFGKHVINPYEDITQVLLYQNEQGPVFSDDWKLESLILKATADHTEEEFTNYTFQKVDEWLHVSRWKEPFTWYKLAWSAPVPWGAWLDAKRKPIDLNCQTYSVNWQPYIGDLKSWRTYDPSQIDGVGYLIGIRNGKLIGELLKTKQTEVLQISDDRHSYTWVFTPSGAIIYKLWDKHNPADYVRHSQLGSGNPVICAGEMQMTKVNDNYVPSNVIAMVNDASGHYKPDGGACLRYVGQKLQELGIPTEQIQWYSR